MGTVGWRLIGTAVAIGAGALASKVVVIVTVAL